MNNWKLATCFFVIAYLIATVVGYALYLMSPVAMWVGVFTLMPFVFLYLAYSYFNTVSQGRPCGTSDAVKLTTFWIVLSLVLDAAVYIVVLPFVFDAEPYWTFFIDQSPWIWLSYAVIAVVVAWALSLHRRKPAGSQRA